MRAPVVLLALVVTPFLADVSQAQGKSSSHGRKVEECDKPGKRKGHEKLSWLLKHFDRGCSTATPSTQPPPAPAPTPAPTPAPAPEPAPEPTPDPTPAPAPTGTDLSGVLFADMDWSGMPNDGEPLLSGWTVELRSNGAVVTSATTDGKGLYKFPRVLAGNYTICVVVKSGYTQRTPTFGDACASGFGWQIEITPSLYDSPWEGLDFSYDAPI